MSSYVEQCLDTLDYLKIVPSYSCSRGCSYCYNTSLDQSTVADQAGFEKAFASTLERIRTSFVAEIIGGEPLEGKTGARTLDILKRLANTPLCRKIVLSTALGDEKSLHQVIEFVDFLYFSVDITRSSANRKRTSERYLQRLVEQCSKNATELCLSVVLDGTELTSNIVEFLGTARSLGIKNVCFGFVSFSNLDRDRMERYSSIFHDLFRAKCLLDGSVHIGGDIVEVLDLKLRGLSRTHNCHCGQSSVVLQPDGKISPSLCFEDSAEASISFDDYIDAKMKREVALLKGECGSCELWNVCQGGCMGAAVASTGRTSSRDIATCNILRSSWKMIRADIANLTQPAS